MSLQRSSLPSGVFLICPALGTGMTSIGLSVTASGFSEKSHTLTASPSLKYALPPMTANENPFAFVFTPPVLLSRESTFFTPFLKP